MDPNTQVPQQQASIPVQPTTPPPINSRKSNKKIIVLVAVTLLVLIIIGLSVFVLVQNGTLGNNTPTPTPSPKPTLAPFPDKGTYSQTTLVIRYKSGSTPDEIGNTKRYSEIQNILKNLGVISQEKIDDYDPNTIDVSYKLTFKEGADVEKASVEIYKLSEIDHAELPHH